MDKNECPGCTDPLMAAVEVAAVHGTVDQLLDRMADLAELGSGSVSVQMGPEMLNGIAIRSASKTIHLLVALEMERPGKLAAIGRAIREYYAKEEGKPLSVVQAEDAEMVAVLEEYAAHLADPDAHQEEAASNASTQDANTA